MYTGNITFLIEAVVFSAVYPCVYREHINWRICLPTVFGLSLCIQGTSYAKPLSNSVARFIPVYTGNMPDELRNGREISVYPCVYREHKWSNRNNTSIHGLSLCIQGTSPVSQSYCKTNRFIPVYTGNITLCTN